MRRYVDLVASEAYAALSARPGRVMLTAGAILLAAGTLVATFGLTQSAAASISGHFDLLKAQEVRVEDGQPDRSTPAYPRNWRERLRPLPDVNAAALYSRVEDVSPSAADPRLARSSLAGEARVIAATDEYLEATRATLHGRSIQPYDDSRRARVAVVGRSVAEDLGVGSLTEAPMIFVGDVPFTVVGIIDGVKRDSSLLLSVVIPRSTAEAMWNVPLNRYSLLLDVDLGAANVVGSQVAVALRPEAPDRFRVFVPPELKLLRQEVEGDLQGLLYASSALLAAIGTLVIANSSSVAVLERAWEIGLRRALGASRSLVAGQFLTESALTGVFGGIIGTSIGVVVVVTASGLLDWVPVMDVRYMLLGPLLGMVAGVLGGLWPAISAARVEPVAALRR